MTDTSQTGQSPIETWSKLIESTMQALPVKQPEIGYGQREEETKKDPWLTLIDRLWQANPYSKLLPIDPAEITRAFQQIWIDAISNPGRAWANYSNFVQQYTQLMTSATLKFWSKDQDVEPVIEP